MRFAAIALALVTLLLTGACDAVLSRDPVGTQPHALKAQEWDGTWIAGNGALITVRVREPLQGRLELALVEQEEDRLEARALQVQLRAHDGVVYASLEADALASSGFDMVGLHSWARVRRQEEQLIFWLPAHDAFERLVRQGVLPGSELENHDLVLEASGDSALATMQGELAVDLFHWDDPLAMIRIAPAR